MILICLLSGGLILYVLSLVSFGFLRYDLGFGLMLVASLLLISWFILFVIDRRKKKIERN